MKIRPMRLPSGWYPRTKEAIESFLQTFMQARGKASAVLVPHAGWFFSGEIAAEGLQTLRSDADTIVLFGGHLGPGEKPRVIMENACESPVGNLLIDTELRKHIITEYKCYSDISSDNTLEVLFPAIRVFFPNARLLAIRIPADEIAYKIGTHIYDFCSKYRNAVAIASSDLTHYGSAYGFQPMGIGNIAKDWVRNVNDAEFLNTVCSGNRENIAQHARFKRSACSAGAVLAAASFAKCMEANSVRIVRYGTSLEKHDSESFVGYAAIAWE